MSLLAPISDVIIIVDVVSFTTCVEFAVSRGAVVYLYSGSLEDAAAFTNSRNAILASRTRHQGEHHSLSPQSLRAVNRGERIVLPSPNGSVLSLGAGPTPMLAGCLRNAAVVDLAAQLDASNGAPILRDRAYQLTVA